MTVNSFEIRRNGVRGDSYSRTLEYIARADPNDDDIAILNHAELTAPASYDGLPRRLPMEVEQVSTLPNIWLCTVNYTKREPHRSEPLSGTANVEYSFELGVSANNVKYSLDTTSYDAVGETVPDFGGAIGVSDDSINGVDIESPQGTFSYTLTESTAFFTPAYLAAVESIVGHVNSTAFLLRDVGEVLFLGASGSVSLSGDSSLTFRFARSANRGNFTVQGVTIGAKLGWQYLEPIYERTKDDVAKRISRKLLGFSVHTVYPTADFASVLGFG